MKQEPCPICAAGPVGQACRHTPAPSPLTEIRRGNELVVLPETPLEIVIAVNNHKALIQVLEKVKELLGKKIDYTELQVIRGMIGETLKAINKAKGVM